ncbi:TonB-dependent receptor plug domain-containing protein [Undibacterium sp. Di24W]|uniref:TonB-dependent receptor plug domain-containing protein n=1 Tax=Undibacterium sp. Di24W TaxID=3413033 RepID=UPI003BF3C771
MKTFSQKQSIHFTFTTIVLISFSGVHAQESNVKQSESNTAQRVPADKTIAQTQQVEIKAKSEIENSRRDAAAKTIVSNAELTRYGDNNIADAMKRVPGVTVVKGIMQLPGMGAGYTQVLVDGEPPRGISINNIPMSTIERVEIYRLGSAEFSSQAIAGTINIILKKVPSSAQQQIKVSVGHYRSTMPSVEWRSSDKRDNISYSLSLRASKFGYPFSTKTSTIEYDKQDQKIREDFQVTDDYSSDKSISINPVIQFKNKEGLSVRSSSNFQAEDGTSHSEQNYQFILGKNLPIQATISDTDARRNGGNSSIRITNQIFSDVKLDFNVSVNGVTSNSKNHTLNYSDPDKLAFIRSSSSDTRENGFSTTLKLSAPSSEEHDIVGGLNFSTGRNKNRRFQTDSDPSFKPIETSDQTAHSVVDNLAFFAQDEWKFRKASSAYFGLRWEAVRVQSDGNTQTTVKNTSSVLSPIIQTLWQLNPENSDRLRVGISRTYKAPSNSLLTSPRLVFPNNSIDNPSRLGNPELKPELAWSLQTSFEHNDKQDLSYSARAVIRKISDLHREQISFFDGIWWRRYVNAGEGLSKVLSFEAQFPLKRFFADSPNTNFSFYAGRTWSSISFLPKPDNLLVPGKVSANMSVDYSAKEIPLALGASLRYQDSNPILLNSVQRNFAHSNVDLDMYASWKFTKKTNLRFSVDNALLHDYPNISQFSSQDSTIWRNNYIKTYRVFRLNLEHSF